MNIHEDKFSHDFEERKPAGKGCDEEPTKALADEGYVDYVEQWKREEGLAEDAIRNIIISQHVDTERAGVEAEHKLETSNNAEQEEKGEQEAVPLSELTDWMLERSRQ